MEDVGCEIDKCSSQVLYQCSHARMCEKHMREHFKVYDNCRSYESRLFRGLI
jgi:hypothetical protein